MDNITNTVADQTLIAPSENAQRGSPRAWLWGGALLAIASLAVFFAQVFWAKVMITPWYMPIGGTVASLMVLYAFACQRRWWQPLVALACIALAGLEWYFLLVLTVLPAYTGPIGAGSGIPAFHATLADGTEINQTYLQQGGPTALVFFQGRWCPFCMTQLQELEEHHDLFDRVGSRVVIVSLEDLETAQATQRDFPHLKVISDQRRELSNAVDLINRGASPDGEDIAAPTILLIDRAGIVQWLHRPARFIGRPSAAELARRLNSN